MAEQPEEIEIGGSESAEPNDVVPVSGEWVSQPPETPRWGIAGPNIDPRDYDTTVLPGEDGDDDDETTLPNAPLAPSDLTAEALGTNSVSLTWRRNSVDEVGFKVQQSLTVVGPWSTIQEVGAGVLAYTDNTAASGTTYYYRVIAFNLGGDSPPSNQATATTASLDPPAAPSDLVAVEDGASQIDLTWVRNSTDEDGFRVERSLSSGGPFTPISNVGTGVTNYSDTELAAGTQFYYQVVAFNGGGDSQPSNEATATTDAAVVPDDPTNLVAITTAPGTNDLSWTDNSIIEDNYHVERSLQQATGYTEIAVLAPDTISYKDESADPNTQYYYRVRASNQNGFSAYTNVASAGGQTYPNGFANRYPIKVQPNMVTKLLDHYMIRFEIQLDALKLETVDPINGKLRNANGYDIVFEEITGTKMPYDRRAQDTTAGTIECWIYTAELYAEHGFYMFVGNETITTDQQDKVAMWANVATMALIIDPTNTGNEVVDASGKQAITINTAPTTDNLLGVAGKGLASVHVNLEGLLDGATEQSSMCWVRADQVGSDQGWVETLADNEYPSNVSYAVWSQRYDVDGAIGGASNNIKYGVGGFTFETNSNRQSLNNQFFAQTWKMGSYPSLYIDGGAAEFRLAAEGVPNAPLRASLDDRLELFEGLQDWAGVFDEYIQFDRELSQDFCTTAYKNQVSTTTFLAVGLEGETVEPGYIPDDPGRQPDSSWEEFFYDREKPVWPAHTFGPVDCSNYTELDNAFAAAAGRTGEITLIRLTADINSSGSKSRTYTVNPNTTIQFDGQGHTINNSGSQCSFTFNGLLTAWKANNENSKVTKVEEINGKTVATFQNLPSGTAPGEWIKLFAPMIDNTIDWRLGASIWSRKPEYNRIGHIMQVESVSGNVVTFVDRIPDAIGQYPVVAQSGRLWGSRYRCSGVDGQGSFFFKNLKWRNCSRFLKLQVDGLVNYSIEDLYIHQSEVVPQGSYPSQLNMGGVRGKMFDYVADSDLGANTKMGFCYAMNFLGGSCENVICNTDQFNEPYNMRKFRDYGDSSSFNLDINMSEQDMARKAGYPTRWGVNGGIVLDTSGDGAFGAHSGSLMIRYRNIIHTATNDTGTPNITIGIRTIGGADYIAEATIFEGLNWSNTNDVKSAVWQWYNESGETYFRDGVKTGNHQGEDTGVFALLFRDNTIHWTSGNWINLSGQVVGAILYGSGNHIHAKKSGGELFYFAPGYTTQTALNKGSKPASEALPDPRKGWRIGSGSTYYFYNQSGRGGRLRNGCEAHVDFPTIDLSNRTTSWTFMDVASGCQLTGGINLINPNGVAVNVTGSGNYAGFQINTL